MAKGQDEMGEIVDNCLGLVKAGQATPESVLEQVSNTPGGVRQQLEMALWLNSASGALNPRPDYVIASRRRLVERIQQEASSARYSRQASLPLPFRMFARWELPGRTHVFHFSLTLLLLILVFLVGQAVLLTSHSAFPGDTFYPVKAAQERIQLSLVRTEIQEAELRIRFTQRRLAEIEALILENRYDWLPSTALEYEEQVNGAVEILQEAIKQDSSRGQELAARLQALLTYQIRLVSALSASLPPNVQQDVNHVLVVSDQNLSTIKGLLDEDENMPVLPASDTPSPAPTTPVDNPAFATVDPQVPIDSPPSTIEPTAERLSDPQESSPMPGSTPSPGVATPAPAPSPGPVQSIGGPAGATPSPVQVEPPGKDPKQRQTKEPRSTKEPKPDPPPNSPGEPRPDPPGKPSDEPKPAQEPKPPKP